MPVNQEHELTKCPWTSEFIQRYKQSLKRGWIVFQQTFLCSCISMVTVGHLYPLLHMWNRVGRL